MFKTNEYNRPAYKAALAFLVFGFLWILLTDRFLEQISPSPDFNLRMQTYKGWLFILITTFLIYFLVRVQIKNAVDLKNQLVVSQKRYKQIVDLSHDIVWIADKDGVINFVNDACENIFGYKPNQVIGHTFDELVDRDQYEKNMHIFRQNIEKGITSMEFESFFVNKRGEKVYLRDNVNVSFDENGGIGSIFGVSKNITSDKLYANELLANKQRLELALLGGELGMWDFDVDKKYFIVNDTWKEITGVMGTDNKVFVEEYAGIVHSEDVGKLQNAFGAFVKNQEKVFNFEHRLHQKDGNWKWVLSKGKIAERDKHGAPVRIIGTMLDINKRKRLELELKYWLEVYSSFVKYANEGIFLYEINKPIEKDTPVDEQINIFFEHGYIKTCNDSFAAMYGFGRSKQMNGYTLSQLQGGNDNPHNIAFLKKFIQSGYRLNNEVSHDTDKDGNLLYISNNLVGIHENGQLVRIWGSQFNITEQVIAQKKLENSEKRYRLLFETNPAPMIIFDQHRFNILDANSAAEKLFQLKRQQVLGLKLTDIRPDIAFYSDQEITALIASELNQTTEVTLKVLPQKSIRAEVRTDQILYEDKSAIIAAINDITLLREAEKMVIRSLIEGEDNERKRVAKEIHDSLGQSLTAASLNLNAVQGSLDRIEKRDIERFSLGLGFLNAAIEESRNIAQNLMPKAIDDFGLLPSLRSLFSQIEKSADIKISFYENLRDSSRLSRNVELNLYRITQEALNNVLKHANAGKIFVQLLLHKSEIIYTFEDDGKGFDLPSLSPESKGMGLKSISNRVKAMSGIFEIDSSSGKGTAITIQIPL